MTSLGYRLRFHVIVAGHPACAARMWFAPDESARLLDLRWWDWSDANIAAGLGGLLSPSPGDLKRLSIDG